MGDSMELELDTTGPTTLLIFKCKNSTASSHSVRWKVRGVFIISVAFTQYNTIGTLLTFKQWTEVPPAGNTPLWCELSHSGLQKEHGNTTRQQEQDIRNQKCTWQGRKKEWQKFSLQTNVIITWPVRSMILFLSALKADLIYFQLVV